jgi:2'-5' RNA ligase
MRIFIGIKLNATDHIKTSRKLINRDNDRRFKWVKEENIHLTLLFIGQVKEHKIEEIKKELSVSLSTFNPFRIRIKGFGIFKKKRKNSILWLNVHTYSQLMKIQKTITQSIIKILPELDIQHENYTPHITIARFHHSIKLPEELLINDRHSKSEFFEVNGIQIIESRPGSKGVEYHVIEEISLMNK